MNIPDDYRLAVLHCRLPFNIGTGYWRAYFAKAILIHDLVERLKTVDWWKDQADSVDPYRLRMSQPAIDALDASDGPHLCVDFYHPSLTPAINMAAVHPRWNLLRTRVPVAFDRLSVVSASHIHYGDSSVSVLQALSRSPSFQIFEDPEELKLHALGSILTQ